MNKDELADLSLPKGTNYQKPMITAIPLPLEAIKIEESSPPEKNVESSKEELMANQEEHENAEEVKNAP